MLTTSQTTDLTVDGTAVSPSLGRGTNGLSPAHVLVLSVWCGLVAGPLEVVTILVRKRTLDLNHFYWMSRHFVWLIPTTDLLIFLGLGLVLSLSVVCWPRTAGWLAARLLCALTLLPLLWAALPGIYGPAGFILALGIAARLVPVLERRAVDFRRTVRLTLPVLAGLLPLLAASSWGADRLKERSDARGPCRRRAPRTCCLIVLDTVAAEHLSLHGYERPTSPTLDGLARRGIRFDRAQATSSWTLPSLASAFTGRWPHELSVGWLTPLDATHPTLAEYLGSRGYATAGFVANTFYCGSDTGLNRGFTVYRDYIFPELSAFKWAVLVSRTLEGIRSIHDYTRRRLKAAFSPGAALEVRRRESQTGRGGQP